MKKSFVPALALILLFAIPAWAQQAVPMEIAGLALGEQYSKYKDRLDMDTAMPMYGQPYITRAKLNPVNGYTGGYVEYGTCLAPGRLLRIKLKYRQDDLGFYTELVKAVAEKYGQPEEWRGNISQTLKNFKWSIPTKDGGSVSMVLMRYIEEDDAFTEGNSIRLAWRSEIEKEKACWLKKRGKKAKPKAFGPAKPDMTWFVPQPE